MENRNAHLFRINYMPDFFVLLLLFLSSVVTSQPVKESLIDVMKKDKDLCENIQVLYESVYTKNCTTSEYPVQSWNGKEDTLDKYLCLGVYDTACKICQYLDHLPVPFTSAVFNSNIDKFSPKNEKSLETATNKEVKYCEDNLKGFTSLYNEKIKYWGPLVDRLSEPHMCQRTCFDFNFNFRPLCAVLAWIKSIEDEAKNAPVTDHNPELDVQKAPMNRQPVDTKETEPKETEKKSEMKDLKEQSHDNKLKNASNNALNEHTQLNTEKVESDPEKSNKHETQKTSNNTSAKVVDHPSEKGKENINNGKVETNAEAPKTLDNAPSKENVNTKEVVKVENAENIDRKTETEDVKTSTISENTQDHYGGSMDDMDDQIDDTGDTIRQPDIENQNPQENPQESIDRSSLQFQRTEGDSPRFFTYFAVTTAACIVCYIGYHNKQKILAIVLEGRRSRNSRGRRRPSTASYRKLDCTLEEAVTSQCNTNVTHVIY